MIARPPAGWRTRAQRAVARGAQLDAWIPGILLDSPISLVGYWWGTTIGWVWGGLMSTGRVQRREGLWVFTGMPEWAFGRGGVCVGGCYLTGTALVTAAVLRHEAVHARQWRRYGFLMPVLYLLAGRNPLTNRFEILAGLEDGNYVPRRS
ncbi:MAG: Fe-S oxidoreductase [Microbacterium sp. SCN 70-200]|uniref:Fe-S oxidoreductase n=1 Tax=unclassified Microbacterium TaxID=2609290 RepID=UPI00086E3588|nr:MULTISPECIES: Fe-S oxidoreductase [unclassified Microbacterium]MBN9213936.1 Fe-S oxidoreductase [Microbacterium sp.]ODT42473.1 MAG: Fe-S oxidoreductase [Microbacterium sp. SCN 70-200]OJV85398.1 MAG: Fe-S oxidoreductase [Microbacterium sp. 70-16]